MKRLIELFKHCCCVLMVVMTVASVNASTYVQLTKNKSVSTSVGSGTVYCTAKRYITGTKKWSASSNVICNAMNGYSSCAFDNGSTFDYKAYIVVTVTMTSYSYQYDSTTRDFQFYYNSSNMTLS